MSKVLKWLDNFWYHYKWTVIVVTFFVSVFIVLGVQLATRENYDAYVMYVGNRDVPKTQYQDILHTLNGAAKDYDEDGEVNVNFSRTTFISDENHEMASMVNASAKEYLAGMSVQPYYIYLMSPLVYDLYKGGENSIFVPISELGLDIPEEWLHDETAVSFSKTDFATSHAGVDNLGEDVLLVIKCVPYSSRDSIKDKETKSYNDHLDLLKTILEYRK